MSLDLTSSLSTSLPSSHRQNKYDSKSKCLTERRVKRELMLWNGTATNLEDQKFSFGSNTNRMQSIVIINEDDLNSEKIITALHLSDKLIHILVNYELKQIIRFSSNDVKILCYHMYQRKKNKISIILSCSDDNIYLFEILKKEKKRKNAQRKSTQSTPKQTSSIFSRVDSSDAKNFQSEWRDYFISSEGIIIKDISDTDVLQQLPESIYQIQSIEPEAIQNLFSEDAKRGGKHILLLSKMQIYKLFQDEETDELVLAPLCKAPSTFHSRVNCLYYSSNTSKISQLSDQNSYILTEEFFQALFGSEFILMTSCICLVGCENGRVFCFPSNKNIIERFSEMSCYRTILTVRNSVQNIIPLSISGTNTSNEKCNSIICVSHEGHIVLLYHDGEQIIKRSCFINLKIASSIVVKNQLIVSNDIGSLFSFTIYNKIPSNDALTKTSTTIKLFDSVEVREIPSESNIAILHELKARKYQPFNVLSFPNTELSFSQLKLTSLDEKKRNMRAKGACTIFTKSGNVDHIIIPSHTAIDDWLCHSVASNRLQNGVREMIQQVDESFSKLDGAKREQDHLNREIYTLNTAMHLLHEWKEQGKKLASNIKCFTRKEDMQTVMECTVNNGTDFVLTNQWTIIVMVEWSNHKLECYSFPINHLESRSTWTRTILLSPQSGYSSFNISVILSFNQTEGHFSLVLKDQKFNMMDLLDIHLEHSNSLRFISAPLSNTMNPSKRIRHLFRKHYKSIPYLDHLNPLLTSTISHTFKLKVNPLEERYTMNWENMLRIPLEEISSLSQDDWVSLVDRRDAKLSSNNFSTPSLLRTPNGEDVKLKISTCLGGQGFEVILQSNQFGSLLASRTSFLEKLKHYLLVRQKIDFTLASYPRVTPKEEIIETIKAMQNIQTSASRLLAEFEQLEKSWHNILVNNHSESAMNSSNVSLLPLIHQSNSLDKKIVETLKELRQTKCAL
ncbi:hypothetical protein C9374_005699 [Naegleria lovaniensis]|uniref:Uncharacterized protein n=1 Tax=Naegleria lovaniensis TaxID=51637 RepID=A0AA88GPA4_NAELO|nr:uncharacterized protein C9374_005699 [Naegleria lovaniensis]KAG2381907.1 hypothetical protein C9374_005699 [Naegleria lovaniensis]